MEPRKPDKAQALRGLPSWKVGAAMEMHGTDDFRGWGLSLGQTLPEALRVQFGMWDGYLSSPVQGWDGLWQCIRIIL